MFCARIRAAREVAGLSRVAVARALKVSLSTYRRYEVVCGLPLDRVEEFVAITGCSFDALLAWGGGLVHYFPSRPPVLSKLN
jgi:hypothetical protein